MSSLTTLSSEYLSANKGPQIIAVIIVFPCLAGIVVALRLYTRFCVVQNPSYEDFAILAAWIFGVATSICQGYQVKNGMGRHVQAITPEQAIGSLKALYASIIVYNFSLTLIKLSIAQQYVRVTIDRPVRQACHAFMLFTVATCFETFFAGLFSCYPIAKFWDDRISGGCLNKNALWFANAGINVAQDIWILVLPVFVLRKLVLPRREKISLCLILGLGGFASLASILRMHALYIVTTSKDITWDNPGTATWSAMEVNIGIICASLPTLRALIVKYFPRTFHLSRGSVRSPKHGHVERHEDEQAFAAAQAREQSLEAHRSFDEKEAAVDRIEDVEKAMGNSSY